MIFKLFLQKTQRSSYWRGLIVGCKIFLTSFIPWITDHTLQSSYVRFTAMEQWCLSFLPSMTKLSCDEKSVERYLLSIFCKLKRSVDSNNIHDFWMDEYRLLCILRELCRRDTECKGFTVPRFDETVEINNNKWLVYFTGNKPWIIFTI